MVRLLVIADDFTGALDTGVQFKASNSCVLLYKSEKENLREILNKEIQVLIIDTETRHLHAEEAYRIVYNIIETAIDLGIQYIYKKTDSGMRGNIGSELAAFWNASGKHEVHFIPAFPQMGRTTVNGIHYIDNVPVAESVFGSDPFEPVKSSAIKDIIAEQSNTPVIEKKEQNVQNEGSGIYVYDSTTEEEMLTLGTRLKENGQLHYLAGCAGFASILLKLLDLESRKDEIPCFNKDLLIICGSINSVTVEQIDCAARMGMRRIALSPEQKLDKDWILSKQGQWCIHEWEKAIRDSGDLIIECGVHDLEETSEYAKKLGIELAESRRRIADTMGGILAELLNQGTESTLLVTGGDTLLAFMEHIELDTLVPACEIAPGVVLSQFEYCTKTFNLLSKSGGFGTSELFVTLSELIKKESVSV